MMFWDLEPEKVEVMLRLHDGKELFGDQWDVAVDLIKADLADLDHSGSVILSWEGELAVDKLHRMGGQLERGKAVQVSFSEKEFAEYANARI